MAAISSWICFSVLSSPGIGPTGAEEEEEVEFSCPGPAEVEVDTVFFDEEDDFEDFFLEDDSKI